MNNKIKWLEMSFSYMEKTKKICEGKCDFSPSHIIFSPLWNVIFLSGFYLNQQSN